MIKRVAINLLTIFLVANILLLGVSFTIKDICVDTVSDAMVKNTEVNKVLDVTKELAPNITDEQYEKVKEAVSDSPKVKEITEKYLNSAIEMIDNKNANSDAEIKSTVKSFVDENISTIEKELNIKVTEDMKNKLYESLESKVEGESSYGNLVAKVTKNMNGTQKAMVKFYSAMTANSTKIILFIVFIFIIVLTALVKESLYKWILNFGGAALTAGIISILLTNLISSRLQTRLTNNLLGKTATIAIDPMVNFGIISMVAGIIMLIIYFILSKRLNKE